MADFWETLQDIGNEIPILEMGIPDRESDEEKRARELQQAGLDWATGYNTNPWRGEGAPEKGWMPEEFGYTAGSPGAMAEQYQYDPSMEGAAAREAAAGGWQSPYEGKIVSDPSQAAQATGDPWGISGQYSAMAGLGQTFGDYRDIIDQGGMTAIDRARWEEAKNRNLGMARGQREASMQEAEMRGMAGGGAELAAMLAANEGAVGRQSAESLGIEAMSQQRRDAAIAGAGQTAGQLGGLSGQVRGDQFNEQFQTGSAADVIERDRVTAARNTETARAQYERERIQRDVDRGNEANAGNVDYARQWYDTDVGNRNRTDAINTENRNAMNEYWFVDEPWRQQEAEERKAAMVTGQYAGAGESAAESARRKREAKEAKMGQMYGAGGGVAAAGMGG